MGLNRTRIRQILIFVGLLVVILLVMDFNTRMGELSRLKTQAGQVSIQATDKVQTQVYIETQIAYATSDLAVEDWARVQGRMIRPGDHPLIPLPAEGTAPTPIPVPVVSPEPQENWRVWLALFVD